jgi:hypothetical protein
MRFAEQQVDRFKIYTIVHHRFLLFPKGLERADGVYEIRWLECTKWLERFRYDIDGSKAVIAELWVNE